MLQDTVGLEDRELRWGISPAVTSRNGPIRNTVIRSGQLSRRDHGFTTEVQAPVSEEPVHCFAKTGHSFNFPKNGSIWNTASYSGKLLRWGYIADCIRSPNEEGKLIQAIVLNLRHT
jgi:hypothetical protein